MIFRPFFLALASIMSTRGSLVSPYPDFPIVRLGQVPSPEIALYPSHDCRGIAYVICQNSMPVRNQLLHTRFFPSGSLPLVSTLKKRCSSVCPANLNLAHFVVSFGLNAALLEGSGAPACLLTKTQLSCCHIPDNLNDLLTIGSVSFSELRLGEGGVRYAGKFDQTRQNAYIPCYERQDQLIAYRNSIKGGCLPVRLPGDLPQGRNRFQGQPGKGGANWYRAPLEHLTAQHAEQSGGSSIPMKTSEGGPSSNASNFLIKVNFRPPSAIVQWRPSSSNQNRNGSTSERHNSESSRDSGSRSASFSRFLPRPPRNDSHYDEQAGSDGNTNKTASSRGRQKRAGIPASQSCNSTALPVLLAPAGNISHYGVLVKKLIGPEEIREWNKVRITSVSPDNLLLFIACLSAWKLTEPL